MNEKTPRPKILIVDDQRSNREILIKLLEPMDYEISFAPNGNVALKLVTASPPDLILLDVVMPGMSGYDVCEKLKQNPETASIPVIFITIKDEKENVIRGFEVGGVDYITKPFEKEEVLARVKLHLSLHQLMGELKQKTAELTEANQRLTAEITRREQAEEQRHTAQQQVALLSTQVARQWGIDGFVGESDAVAQILDDIRQLQSTETTGVLIAGESGTGKELVARAIHFGSPSADKPFIAVNCSAIPAELAESEFFGHVRGAYTGAQTAHKGYFELADGGTLFLDEVGDMPLQLQAKLLRVLEEKRIRPVGAEKEKPIDVRVIAATNAPLEQELANDTFRRDFYFRLARFQIRIPPLRDRRDDIPPLIEHFLDTFATEMGIQQPQLRNAALETLMGYDFPGNVRELKNIIEYALIKSGGASIEPHHLQLIAQSPPATTPPTDTLLVPRRSPTDEERIEAYVRQNGSINNAECRQLLSVDKNRATYLLEKMRRANLLHRRGASRAVRYELT